MLNLKQFNTAEVQFGRNFFVDTAPETPFHNLVWVDTDFTFMLVNSRWFTCIQGAAQMRWGCAGRTWRTRSCAQKTFQDLIFCLRFGAHLCATVFPVDATILMFALCRRLTNTDHEAVSLAHSMVCFCSPVHKRQTHQQPAACKYPVSIVSGHV